jgi:phosphatidylglycerophosphate synthase
MTTRALIFGDAPVRLWGLSSRERLARQLARVGVRYSGDGGDRPSGTDPVVLIRADHVYDDRVIAAVVKTPGMLLRAGRESTATVVAANVTAEQLPRAETVLSGRASADVLAVRHETPDTLVPVYQKQLRKAEPPLVRRIVPDDVRALENRLFSGSYKGVTDLITKWVWPLPARWVTRVCARAGLHPNHVTALGTVLALVAGVLFAWRAYAWGLALGWLMTFLDTVDGKLARVTIRSSRFGHILDHGTDLLHPPLWYLAWGAGLAGSPAGLPGGWLTLAVIVVGYVVGRLVEGAFHLWLGEFSIFCWRRVDSWFRLVTARRNPNLVLLTAGTIAGRPDVGLVAVAVWTAVSSAILLVRFGMAAHARATTGPLRSWLEETPDARARLSLATRLFAGPVARDDGGGAVTS